VKMLDTDNDGTLDLAECKAAGAATFDKLDADKSATLDQGELGDRATITIVSSPHGRMFFQTRPSKDDYVGFIVKQFERADPDHEGKLDAKELETEEGQSLVKLLH
jgi:EF hand